MLIDNLRRLKSSAIDRIKWALSAMSAVLTTGFVIVLET
jgi:hypothetical protein